MRGILILGLAFWWAVPGPADAKSIVEAHVQCDPTLRAFLDDGGTPHVVAACVTVDAAGAIVRGARDYDVTNRLTAAQRAGLVTILQQLQTHVAQNEAIPTPTPKSTP